MKKCKQNIVISRRNQHEKSNILTVVRNNAAQPLRRCGER